jgi:type II secretion system protein L
MNRSRLLYITGSADLEASVATASAEDPSPLTVLVPAVLVPRISTSMPSMPAHKLRQAAAFAIEDRLIGDIESQHLTVVSSRPSAAGQLEVELASIDRSWLSELLRTLDAAGLKASAVYADADCITAKPGDVLLWIDGTDAHWVTPSGSRRTWPVDALQEALDWALVDIPAGTLGLRVYASQQDLLAQAAALEQLRPRLVSIQSQTIQSPLDWLSGQLETAAPPNLLHDEFAPQRSSSDRLRRWRLPLWIAAAMVATLIAQIGVDALVASSRANAIEQRIAASAGSLLPPGTATQHVVPLLERQLTAMTARSASSPTLETVNSLIATSLANSNNLDRLELQPDRVTLQLRSATPEQISLLRTSAATAGWQMSEQASADGLAVIDLVRP